MPGSSVHDTVSTTLARAWVMSTEAPQDVCPVDQRLCATTWVPNHLLLLPRDLNNRYIVVRHGESEANLLKIIASESHRHGDQIVGLGAKFGLSEEGRAQVRARAFEFAQKLTVPNNQLVIVHSDLKRTSDTAALIGEVLALSSEQILPSGALRERLYGCAEGASDECLPNIYQHDVAHPWKGLNRAESLANAVHRVTALICDLERDFLGKTVILVTHSSPAKVLEAAFTLDFEANHDKVPKFGNGEFREMRLAPGLQ